MNKLAPHEKLATALSAAVRIEPELMRAVRLAVFPHLDVSAEADLWFSPLVRSRGPHGIVFDQDVLGHLRARLTSWLTSKPPSDPVHRIGDIMATVHKRLSPALALEERVTWLVVTGRPDAIDDELRPALKALVQEHRTGLADWFTAAWHRLPDQARQSVTAWKIAQVVRPDLRGASPSLGVVRTPASGTDLSDIVPMLPDTRLLLRRFGHTLQIGDFEPTSDTVGILVPDTDPRLLQIGAESVAVAKGTSEQVEVGRGTVRVTTARGAVYVVAPPPRPASRFLGVEVLRPLSEPDLVWRADLEGLASSLGEGYDTEDVLHEPTEVDLRERLNRLARSMDGGTLVVAWHGWATTRSGEPELLLADSGKQRALPLRRLLDDCAFSGADQVLVVLDVRTRPSVVMREWHAGLSRAVPEYPDLWMRLLVSTYEAPMTVRETFLTRLHRALVSGPLADNKIKWHETDEHITCDQLASAVSAVLLGPDRTTPPAPTFANPLYRAEADAAPPLTRPADDGTGNVWRRTVIEWARSGSGVFVIAGGSAAGRTALLDQVQQQVDLVRRPGDRVAELRHIADRLPPVVAIDGVDEGGADALNVIAELRERSTPRAILATIDTTSPLLGELAPHGPDLDLDDHRATVIRFLSVAPGLMDPDVVTEFLTNTQKMPPLLVHRVARVLREQPVSTAEPAWREQTVERLVTAFNEDTPVGTAERNMAVLLAWSRGAGMPRSLLLACASSIWGSKPNSPSGLVELLHVKLRQLRTYAVSTGEGYRLAHPVLERHLKSSTPSELLDQITAALIHSVPADGEADAYLRRHLRDHAADAGEAGLRRLGKLAARDRQWLPDHAAAARDLACRTTGTASIALAQQSVAAFIRLAGEDPTFVDELVRALDVLAARFLALSRTVDAALVWPAAISRATPALAASLRRARDRRTPQPPSRRAGEIRPYDMVIVVPGVKGNVLHGPDGKRITAPPLPDDIGDEHPDDGVVPGMLSASFYGTLLDRLRELGYREDTGNLLTVPYDWRLSYRWTGRRIGEQAEEALARWRDRSTLDAQIVFVCVGTGGLPVRWYVERCGGAEITARTITIGMPVAGSEHRLRQLINGEPNPARAPFWRSLPSTYQSLPASAADVDLPHLNPHLLADGVAFLNDLLAAERSRPGSAHDRSVIPGPARLPLADVVLDAITQILAGRAVSDTA